MAIKRGPRLPNPSAPRRVAVPAPVRPDPVLDPPLPPPVELPPPVAGPPAGAQFPKWLYHRSGDRRVVETAAAQAALGPEWAETPGGTDG
jgi:hypothetical protein